MFSCETKKGNARSLREQGRGSTATNSLVTPARTSINRNSAVPNRPATGTPAPWAPSLSFSPGFLRLTKVEKETMPILPNLFSSVKIARVVGLTRACLWLGLFVGTGSTFGAICLLHPP